MDNDLNKTIYILFTILFLCGSAFLFPKNIPAQETRPDEYQVKAAFLYNFVKFIDWPAEALANNTAITLCIIGRDPFEGNLALIQGKPVKGKTLDIRNIKSVREAGGCRLLFISSSEKNYIAQILRDIRDHSIITIGDYEGFAQQGVIINFYIDQEKVRFEINVDAARRTGMQISSKLLKLARIVN
jgi:hypothetical protein